MIRRPIASHRSRHKCLSFFLLSSDVLLAHSPESAEELNVSNASSQAKRRLLPTITMAIGILVGGLLGVAAGSFSGNESVTIACYVIGFLGGAVAGAMIGRRITRIK